MPLTGSKPGCKLNMYKAFLSLLICLLIFFLWLIAFEDDSIASVSQDSSFGDENSQQEQDPLAIELKVSFDYNYTITDINVTLFVT